MVRTKMQSGAHLVGVYTQNLIEDTKNPTEIKNFHLEKWTEILKKYELATE